MADDISFMTRALALARRGRFTAQPNPAVGCVLVRQEQIVGEGFHRRVGEAHAEVEALHAAGDYARDATAYVTLEPCSHLGHTPPCTEALIRAGVKRVVIALIDPNPQVSGKGVHILQQAGIEVAVGVMADEVEALNSGFLKRMRTGLPYLRLKLATSLDGRTALANGESHWITSCAARRDVQGWRAESAAILSTSATVLADDPLLTVRWEALDPAVQVDYPKQQLQQPIRILLDRRHQITPAHRVIAEPGPVWLVTSRAPKGTWPAHVEHLQLSPNQQQRLDLVVLLKRLGESQINTIWVEAGATLAGALLQANLVDELILYIAPKLLGNQARALCILPELTKLKKAPRFIFTDIAPVGNDLRLRLKPHFG